MVAAPQRYHALAIALHWVMALAFLCMLASGLTMTEEGLLNQSQRFALYQWHKSLGVLLLGAFVLRLAVRLLARVPALPGHMKPLERKAAALGHFALYAVMLAMPLSGWLMVSASPYGLPTIVFGWFEWPHVPNVAANHAVEEAANEAHELLAYFFMALIGVHVAAVVKHAKFDRINLLPRMGIGRVPANPN